MRGLLLVFSMVAPAVEPLALSSDGAELLFTSHLLLRGEESRTMPITRVYRFAPSRPVIETEASNGESFGGVFLSSAGVVAQYCRKVISSPRPIPFDGVCLAGNFLRGESARFSRNGRFLLLRPQLLDLASGTSVTLPDIIPLHTHNAISDAGAIVAHHGNPRTVARFKAGEPPRVIYEGDAVTQAAISADGRYAFLRAGFALVEIDLATNARRTIYRTEDDHYTFQLSGDASRVMIRHYHAVFVWDRAANAIHRFDDTPALIVSAVMSDDGSTIVYQLANGSITRIRGSAEELYGETPTALIPQGMTAYPGSAVFFTSRGISEKTELTLAGQPATVIRAQPDLVMQIPWEAFPAPGVIATAANPGSPFLLRVEVPIQREPMPAFFNYYDPAAQSFVVTAALNDFSVLASSMNPAPAGSTIHVYLGALGPLDQPVATGQPGPSAPPASPLARITCDLQNLNTNTGFRHLEVLSVIYAPGLIGVYQADIAIPANWPSGANRLLCRSGQSGDETLLFTRAAASGKPSTAARH